MKGQIMMTYKIRFIGDEASIVTVMVDSVLRSTHQFQSFDGLMVFTAKLHDEEKAVDVTHAAD